MRRTGSQVQNVANSSKGIVAGGNVTIIHQASPPSTDPPKARWMEVVKTWRVLLALAAALIALTTALLNFKSVPRIPVALEEMRTTSASWIAHQQLGDLEGLAFHLDQVKTDYIQFTNLLFQARITAANEAAHKLLKDQQDYELLIAKREQVLQQRREVDALGLEAKASLAPVFAPKSFAAAVATQQTANQMLHQGHLNEALDLFTEAANALRKARRSAEGFQVLSNELRVQIHMSRTLSPGEAKQQGRDLALGRVSQIYREEFETTIPESSLNALYKQIEVERFIPGADDQICELSLPLAPQYLNLLTKISSPQQAGKGP